MTYIPPMPDDEDEPPPYDDEPPPYVDPLEYDDPPPPNISFFIGGGAGVLTVATETSPIICRASLHAWY